MSGIAKPSDVRIGGPPRLKHHLSAMFSGGTPETGNQEFWSTDESGIPWVAIGDMSGRERVESTQKCITEAGRQSRGLTLISQGTLIYSMYASLGHVAELAIPATINQALLGFQFKSGVNQQYVKWQLRHLQARIVEESSSNTQDNLNAEKVRNLPVPLPSVEQQQAIANYLDQETARLDALVGAKERLLGLLAEKRRALITRAVTRGLDPRATLRDSGVPWLGEIPAHWRSMRLRFLMRHLEQGWSPEAENREPGEGEWGVLKLNAVSRGRFDQSAAKALPPDFEIRADLEVHRGDFLVTRSNTPASVGDACFVDETRQRLMLCDLIYRLTLREEVIDGKFLGYFLTLPEGRGQIEADARGTSGSMVKISQDHIKDWWIPVPPPDEQAAIVAQVGRETGALDELRGATERTIALLKERRAALIATAVTGRINPSEVTTNARQE